MSNLIDLFARLPVEFTRGQGAWLEDSEGRRYLDALSGIAVNGLGHAHPKLVAAVAAQAARLIHVSNLYRIPEQETLAQRLCALSGMAQAFFCNSGCEANEAAIKLARLYGHNRGIDNPQIIVMEHAFHGRTMATLSATGNRKVQAGFEPLMTGFARVPYNDIEAIRRVAATHPNIVAVLVEPIQGEGGIQVPDADYLRALRTLCDAHEWLFMLDEVQSGIARTGRWFAFQHAGVLPDAMALAKGLGGGVPIGALLVAGRGAGVFHPGAHGSTFGGNPLACAAGLATLNAIEEEGLLERARRLGEHLLGRFRAELGGLSGVRQIRGLGLMLGIELEAPCSSLVATALADGLLINVTAERVIRLLPPLVLSDAEADELADRVTGLVRRHLETRTD